MIRRLLAILAAALLIRAGLRWLRSDVALGSALRAWSRTFDTRLTRD